MNNSDKPAGMPAAKKPDWLRVKLGHGPEHRRMRDILKENRLHTVCEEALCPNIGECWKCGHATIMILGGTCSRNCRFCNVSDQQPLPPDIDEPQRVAAAVGQLSLKHIVITSVTRDDLADGGAAIWAETVSRVRKAAPQAVVEVLIPDFNGDMTALHTVINAGPDILGHNLETVPRLYPMARPQADYRRSLTLLAAAAQTGCHTKTGIMLGMGETAQEIRQTITDARDAGVSILYLGQYLQPSKQHLPVAEYINPDRFEQLRQIALEIGIPVVASGPLIRSSYPSADQTAFVNGG